MNMATESNIRVASPMRADYIAPQSITYMVEPRIAYMEMHTNAVDVVEELCMN